MINPLKSKNFWAGLDSRIKFIFVGISLLLVISARTPGLPLLFLALAGLELTLMGKLPGKRFLPALFMAAMVWLTQAFLYGQEPLWQIGTGGWELTLYREGISRGALLASRVLGGVALLLLLTAAITLEELIATLAWFKVPRPLLEIMTLAARYIQVFGDEQDRVIKGRKMRLGHSTWLGAIKSYATAGGIVLVRAFDRSEALYKAMTVRGYTGEMEVTAAGTWEIKRADLLGGTILALILAAIYRIFFWGVAG